MKTVILNGSPKGDSKICNTELFIRQFVEGAGEDYPVRHIAKEDSSALAASLAEYDTILFFFPLYVHAMPGTVMKLIEKMTPAREGQRIGFFIQFGFMESAQTDYVKGCLAQIMKQLGYENIGVVVKGDSAGTYMLPRFMNRKTFRLVNDLGRHYSVEYCFSREVEEKLSAPYRLKESSCKLYDFLNKTGLNHIIWKKMWKDNGAKGHGLDAPFAEGQ